MNPFKKINENTYQDSEGILYKPIPHYEDYFVSNMGEIYSTKWGKWKKLKTHLNENHNENQPVDTNLLFSIFNC